MCVCIFFFFFLKCLQFNVAFSVACTHDFSVFVRDLCHRLSSLEDVEHLVVQWVVERRVKGAAHRARVAEHLQQEEFSCRACRTLQKAITETGSARLLLKPLRTFVEQSTDMTQEAMI